MAKFKGKGLSLLVDGEEFSTDGTSVVLDSEDADTEATTFDEYTASGGGTPQDWFFTLNAVSDYGAGSFWSILWDLHVAGDEVAYIFKPYGNASASTSQPHFTGSITVPRKPPIGGDAGSVWTFEQRLDCTGEPVRDTTP